MQRIDFYLLDTTDVREADTYACRLAEKAYRMRHTIYFNAADPAHAEVLDQLLWTFRQGSFLPHSLVSTQHFDDPIVVGDNASPGAPRDLLINLAAQPRDDFAAYSRIAEIVSNDPQHKRAARARYRFYREHGLEPRSHHISG